jgi:hypothetical protein
MNVPAAEVQYVISLDEAFWGDTLVAITMASTNWFESVEFIESVCGHFLSLRYAIPPSRDQLVFAYHDSQAPFAPVCDAR